MSNLKLHLLAIGILLLISLAGCGQTGDLYLPEDDPKQKSKHQSNN